MRARRLGFVALMVVLVIGTAAYVVNAVRASSPEVKLVALDAPVPSSEAVVYVDTDDAGIGALSWAAKGRLDVAPHQNGLQCARTYFAHQKGICVAPNRTKSGYVAKLYDDRFIVTGQVDLQGVPSRARVSSDGRLGAVTMFVQGDSYTSDNFSTRTTIIDMAAHKALLDLEKFRTTKNGKILDAPDLNYWGVTFADDSNTFYATLGTDGETYLVKGDVAKRSAEVVRSNVQCPSLSPDGTRIAYKKVGTDEATHFTVLNLKNMTDTELAEPTPIDDQLAWLDNDTVAYGTVDSQIYAVPVDGTGVPVQLSTHGQSPSAN